ncbi:receptor-like protein 12 [Prunus avium]|uniref:Receptor-like protein 12 n=1 Tax=Prunus avium TaxID=42229 RepID=A0A6P5TLH8_PRUAV|nr:receptor-like protein 12 [Prunus avium]
MKTFLQYFFLLFLNITTITICGKTIPSVHSRCIKDQQLSLLHLKKSLIFNGDSYDSYPTKVISWNSSTDCCSWLGVTCSTNGRVVRLDLSGESISGGIDNSSSLFNLQHLQSLNLANNMFGYGSRIPSAIGKLTNLRYLNLSYNGYSGQVIPIEISRLARLVILDISNMYDNGDPILESPNLSMLLLNLTQLTELYLDGVSIPAHGTHWSIAISSSLPNLSVLSLSSCNLSGPIDQSLAKLHSLSVIRLDHNYLISGPIPGFFANFSNLREFNWDGNNISGPVPLFFSNFSKLTSLNLVACELRGTFPKQIFQIPTLQTINLYYNGELHGSLPEFPKNGSLRSLDLSLTNFSGLMPDSIGNLKMLSTINLLRCNFTGSIPKSLANLTQLVYLDLSSNMFNGPISSIHWEKLSNLVHLQLNDNLLEGSIPSSLFYLPLLPELVLSDNQFSGKLSEFPNVSSYLFTIDLSFNNLEGQLPVSIFNFRGLESLRLSSNNFSAFPFNGPQQLKNLTYIDLSYNSLLSLYNGTDSSYSSFPQLAFLYLASNKLRTIPYFLRNQSALSSLDLSENQIEGKIPHWIWSFKYLYDLNLSCNSLGTLEAPFFYPDVRKLDLHSNQLQGKLPIFLPNAFYLDYSQNNFSSVIPTDIGDFLTSDTSFLSFSSNNLHGYIPVSICNGGFGVLDLSNNSLSGMIPQCLSAKESLGVLNLRRNNLTGTISNFEFPKFCELDTLNLGENQIKGQFPKSLANCTGLQVLNLGENHLVDTFPCLLKNISTLRVLVLQSNKFYGRIECPKTHGTWPMLQIINLAHNNFNGEIPRRSLTTWRSMMANEGDSLAKVKFLEFSHPAGRDGVGFSFEDGITVTSKGSQMDLLKILSIFTLIDFSCNNFSGLIPKEIGKFKSLYVLNLSGNAFTGEIPSSFGNMRVLESLDLSQNKLSGQIPPQLANLTFLSFLNLSYNQLVGKIPTSTQFSTFPKDSFIGNKGLWGPPLTVDNKAPPPALNESLPNSGHRGINWNLISVEIGFTVGFGVSVGSLVLCKKWSKWYYRAMYKMVLKIFPQLEEIIGIHRRHVHINQRWRH